MRKNRIFNGAESFFSIIYYLAKLNLYFWIFTVRGGVLLGFSPATVALIDVLSYGDINEVKVNIKKTFSEKYKESFAKANKIGILLAALALIFYFNFLAMVNGSVSYSLLNVFAFFTILFCYASIAMWIFPLISRSDMSTFETLKYALILGVSHIHYTFFLVILLFSLLYFSLTYPALLLFFFYSSFYLILAIVTKKPIEKLVIYNKG